MGHVHGAWGMCTPRDGSPRLASVSTIFLDSPALLGPASWSAVVMTVISDQDFVIIAVPVNVRVCVFRLVGRRSVLWGDQNLRRTVWPRHSGLLHVASDPLHLKNCSGQVGDHRSCACNQLTAVRCYGKIAQNLTVTALCLAFCR